MVPSLRHPNRLFGQRVRALRAAAGLTQEEVGTAAGLHRTYIGGVERGERNLTLRTVERLADILGVEPLELLTVTRPT